MDACDAVKALCGSEARFRLVRALFEAPDEARHLRGLAGAARVDPAQVHKLLPQLVQGGLCEAVADRPYRKYRARTDSTLGAALAQTFARHERQDIEDTVDLRDAPILRSLLWSGRERGRIPAPEAFRHYEDNWRFVQRAALTPAEKRLIERLKHTYGGGLING